LFGIHDGKTPREAEGFGLLWLVWAADNPAARLHHCIAHANSPTTTLLAEDKPQKAAGPRSTPLHFLRKCEQGFPSPGIFPPLFRVAQ
jgi:hypothetical protein